MGQHETAVFPEMGAVTQDGAISRCANKLFEYCFPIDQRCFHQIVAVEMQEIECVENETVRSALA